MHNLLRVRVLRSGSAGNAILVEAGTQAVLIDAGLPADALQRGMRAAGANAPLTAILLTHEHDDHLKGVAAVARATAAPVFATEDTLRATRETLAGCRVEAFRAGRPFRVGEIDVLAFPLPHDAADPVGFTLSWGGARVAAACDLGEVTDTLLEHARGADLFLIEANYDVRLMGVSAYPWFLRNRILGPRGHLSNEGAALAAVGAATGDPQTVMLVHLSEETNLAPLARDVVRAALDAEGLSAVRVEAVRPNDGGPWWTAPAGSLAAGRAAPDFRTTSAAG